MKKEINPIIFVGIIVISFFISGCANFRDRTIELSFRMNKVEALTSSDQMVVWIEKPDSTFIQTLFISEYLAYGGFNISSVCPDWSGRSGWKEISKENFDAVTGATPTPGKITFKLKVPKDKVPDGEYRVSVEVHLAENYNELYSGLINLSNKKCGGVMKVKYVPKKHPLVSNNILSNVKIICK